MEEKDKQQLQYEIINTTESLFKLLNSYGILCKKLKLLLDETDHNHTLESLFHNTNIDTDSTFNQES